VLGNFECEGGLFFPICDGVTFGWIEIENYFGVHFSRGERINIICARRVYKSEILGLVRFTILLRQ